MKAMLLRATRTLADDPAPLQLTDWPEPEPRPGEVRIRVHVCGVCHTELDEIEGRAPPSRLPIVLGHQVVGTVDSEAPGLRTGQRVGVAWIFSACGACESCRSGRENLCAQFQATGRDADGGYAQYMKIRADFAHPIPDALSDADAAPLLCAGAIGYRALRLSGIEDGQSLGLYGFGGSNHLVLKLAQHKFPQLRTLVFSRSRAEREFALALGATWAGDIGETPPVKLHAAIDTTPVWQPDLAALAQLRPGGRLVINAIRKEERDKAALLGLDYPSQLWLEKEVRSVANVTRADVREFLALAAESGLRPEVREYALEDANAALLDLKDAQIRGAKVLRIAPS